MALPLTLLPESLVTDSSECMVTHTRIHAHTHIPPPPECLLQLHTIPQLNKSLRCILDMSILICNCACFIDFIIIYYFHIIDLPYCLGR